MSLRIRDTHEHEGHESLKNRRKLDRLLTKGFRKDLQQSSWNGRDYGIILGKLCQYEEYCARHMADFHENVGRISRMQEVADIYVNNGIFLSTAEWTLIEEEARKYIESVLDHFGIKNMMDFYIIFGDDYVLDQSDSADPKHAQACEIFFRHMIEEAKELIREQKQEMVMQMKEGAVRQRKQEAIYGYLGASLRSFAAIVIAILTVHTGIQNKEKLNGAYVTELVKKTSKSINLFLSSLVPEEDYDIEGLLKKMEERGEKYEPREESQ